jgi:hypothetical protein
MNLTFPDQTARLALGAISQRLFKRRTRVVRYESFRLLGTSLLLSRYNPSA